MNKSILEVLLERSIGSLYLDIEGRIVSVSGEWPEVFQDSCREGLIGRHFANLLETAYRASVSDIIERCTHKGRSEAVAFRFLGSSELRQLHFTPKELTAADWPARAVIRVQDVTMPLRGQDLSVLSKELFDSIINDIGEGIVVFDPARKITHVNDVAAQLLGKSKEDLIDKAPGDLPGDLNALMPGPGALDVLKSGLEIHKVEHLQRAEGDELSLLINYYPVSDTHGRITHVVETLQDITEEQQTAQKIQEINRRLQEKAKARSVLLKLSSDFNICRDGAELYPRLTATIVCGMGLHDTVAVLALREDTGGELILRSYFGTDHKGALQLREPPESTPTNVVTAVGSPEFPAFLSDLELISAVYSPIVIDGETVGFLNIFHRTTDPFIKDEETLLRILTENLGHFIKRVKVECELREKVITLSLLKEISDSLQRSKTLDEIMYVLLTGVTAREGLGFNRAFLLLFNEKQDALECRLAVGPASREEAGRIWHELQNEKLEFSNLLTSFGRVENIRASELNQRFSGFSLGLKKAGIIGRVFEAISPLLVGKGMSSDGDELLRVFSCGEIALAPLFATDFPIGLLMVDNSITASRIGTEDLRFLNLVAKQAQAALESYFLYEELQQKVSSLRRSNALLQDQSVRLAKLERLSALGEMATTVAHEIRNPLVSIGGFARSLLADSRTDDPDNKYLRIIAQEVSRLEKVVANLLNFAKPIKPNLRPLPVRKIIEQAIAMLGPEFAEAGVALSTQLDRRGLEVMMDPDLILQTLLNMISNALQAMPGGGRLRISTRCVGGFVQIYIKDTGVGIAPEHRDNIFEPFFTTRSSGVGLGLAIVQNIIKSHNGRIWFRSVLGRGTVFVIRLPLLSEGDTGGMGEAAP